MSEHDHHEHPRANAAPMQRRDLLGLAALFPAGSNFVPISDIDGSAMFGDDVDGGCTHGAALLAQESDPQGTHCASCALPCPSEQIAHARDESHMHERNP